MVKLVSLGLILALSLGISVFGQTAQFAPSVQLNWPAQAAANYTVTRSDGLFSVSVDTNALTDFRVEPGKSYTYTIQPGNQQVTVTLPPLADVRVQFKPGQKLSALKLTRRKTDISTTMQCTVNKSTTVEFLK